jgi:hypothetical protein
MDMRSIKLLMLFLTPASSLTYGQFQFSTLGSAPDLRCPVAATATSVQVNCPVAIDWKAQTDGTLLATLTPTFEWSEDPETGIRTVKSRFSIQAHRLGTGAVPFSVRFDFFNKNNTALFSIQRPFGGQMNCGIHVPLGQAPVMASPRAATMVHIYGEGGAWRNC